MIDIRKASVNDFLKIAELDRVVWINNSNPNYIPDGEHVWRMWVEHTLVYCAVINDEVVGAVIAFPTETDKYCIHKIFVDEKHREKGIAKKMFISLLKEIDKKKLDCFLTVDPKNTRAIDLFKKLGFDKETFVKGFYREEEDRAVLTRSFISSNIILIGPIRSGKSTLGNLLAQKLEKKHCPMDELRWKYYKEAGYDETLVKTIEIEEGFLGVYQYWKPFEAYSVVKLLSEVEDSVIDLGAGHSVYEEEDLFNEVQNALAKVPNVILILPSPDLDESIKILNERTNGYIRQNFDFHTHFVKDHSNHDLAKKVVYTKGKTPDETANEIINLLWRR